MKASHILIPLGTLVLAGSALAQVPPPVPPDPSRGDEQRTQQEQQQERQQEQTQQAMRKAAEILDKRRASTIIGRNVNARDGDNIGEVKDLILDDKGQVTHAVVSYGGAAGLGAKQVAVPWQDVMGMVRSDRIVMDKSQLQNAPALPEGQPDLTSRDWSREIDRYWQRIRSAAADGDRPAEDTERR